MTPSVPPPCPLARESKGPRVGPRVGQVFAVPVATERHDERGGTQSNTLSHTQFLYTQYVR